MASLLSQKALLVSQNIEFTNILSSIDLLYKQTSEDLDREVKENGLGVLHVQDRGATLRMGDAAIGTCAEGVAVSPDKLDSHKERSDV